MRDFEALYRQHASAIFRFAWGLCGDRSQAEDIVSDTFLRLLTRAPRVRTETARAYLLAIARNSFLSGLRGQRPELPVPEQLPDRAPDPAQQLEDEQGLEAVVEALAELPEGERAALLLRVDQELSYEEIAMALGTTPGAAKVRVHRARVRLASTLERRGRTT